MPSEHFEVKPQPQVKILNIIPLELQIIIILFLNAPTDFLHLALTSRYFYNIIITKYQLLLFNNISCSIFETSFWTKLSLHSHFYSSIRQLKLNRDRDFFSHSWLMKRSVDKEFLDQWTLKGKHIHGDIEAFLQCLPHMQLLQRFHAINTVGGNQAGIVFERLANYRYLKALELYYISELFDLPTLPPNAFNALTTLILYNINVGQGMQSLLQSVFKNCTSITDVAIKSCTFSTPFSIYLLYKANWPFLRRLSVYQSFFFTETKEHSFRILKGVIKAFFEKHQLLEALILDNNFEDILKHLDISTLFPALRSLKSEASFIETFPPGLTHVETILYGNITLGSTTSSLESCILNHLDLLSLTWFISCLAGGDLPNLQHVSITSNAGCQCDFRRRKIGGCACKMELMDKLFQHIGNLQHFQFIFPKATNKLIDNLHSRIQDLQQIPTFFHLCSTNRNLGWRNRFNEEVKGKSERVCWGNFCDVEMN